MISAIILAKNAEKTIGKTLASIDWVDEVLVVDDESQDNSIQMARDHGARVIERKMENDFATQRNFADRQAKGEGILHIDADEEVSEALAGEILKLVQDDMKKNPDDNEIHAYHIKRRDVWWGRELKYGEVHKAAHIGFILLYKKGSGVWVGAVHEQFKTDEKTGILSSYLIHRPHPSISSFLKQINKYSSIRADELHLDGCRSNVLKIMFFPPIKFWYNYLLRFGFLEGVEGFIYAFFMAFHTFL